MNEKIRVRLGVAFFVALFLVVAVGGVYMLMSRAEESAPKKDSAEQTVVVVKSNAAMAMLDEMQLDGELRQQMEMIINVAYDEGRSDAVEYMLKSLDRYVAGDNPETE